MFFKLKIIFITLLVVFLSGYVHANQVVPGTVPGAAMAPQPPETNPHPPLTELDKKRVEFAEKSILALLSKPLPQVLKMKEVKEAPSFLNKDLACLQNATCYEKESRFVNELIILQNLYGQVIETKHSHIIPWSIEKYDQNKNGRPTSQPSKPLSAEAATMTPINTMPAPLLQKDEYMVHVYAKFNKNNQWNHLDVILSEDEKGNIYLRHFFTTPIPASSVSLPPGVVCVNSQLEKRTYVL